MRFTETFARSSARHPWRTVGVWAVILVVGIALSAVLLGDALSTTVDFTDTPEAKEAALIVEESRGVADEFSEFIVVTSDSLTLADPAYAGYVEALSAELISQTDIVRSVGSDLAGGGPIPSESGRTVILEVKMVATDVDQEATDAAELGAIVHDAGTPEGVAVYISGPGTASNDFTHLAEEGLQRGEAIGVLIALIVLVVVFGTIVAAVVPIGVAIVAIAISMGVVGLMGLQFEFSFFVTNMITMIGLAVGIDYSLFIVSRYREERGHGLDLVPAISRAGATASRAVFFSGMTVVLALLGMFIVPNTIFRSLATGAIVVTLLAVAAALTLLPAVMALLGDRIEKGRVPPWFFVGVLALAGLAVTVLGNPVVGLIVLGLVAMLGVGIWLRERNKDDEDPEGQIWDTITHAVMGRPVLSLVLSAGFLIILAIPFFSMERGAAGIDTLPEDVESRQAFEVLTEEFGASTFSSPVEIVVIGSRGPEVDAAVAVLIDDLASEPAANVAQWFPQELDAEVLVVSVPLTSDTTSPESVELVHELRDELVPAAFAGTSVRVLVGGDTAFQADFFEDADYYWPYVFAFVLGLSFLLLMVVFRSIVVPIKAIILNLLSVFAAYGVVVAFFQAGTGPEFIKDIADFLSFGQVSQIEAWLPLFLFSVLFGLSMDYHVFLLSRIREHFDKTGDNTESVAHGLRSTGAIITGAALIMVAVFGGFAAGELVPLQQMGFGLAVAVFLDATIVRSVLVPSSMKLLGDRNWYLPSWLQWLPKIDVEGSEEVEEPGGEPGEREPAPVG